jgi:MFS transporter, DHA3 family, macrolide efflux protein
MNRRFGIFLLAQSVSNFGDWLSLAGMTYLVFLRAGTTDVGIFQSIGPFVALLAGPILGLLIDYGPAKKMMIWTNTLLAIVSCGFLYFELHWYVVLLIIKATLSVAFGAAYGRFFPTLVDKSYLDQACGWVSTTGQVATVLGLSLGTYCTALWGKGVFLLDAATFVFATVCFSSIPIEVAGVGRGAFSNSLNLRGLLRPLWQDLRDGARYAVQGHEFVALLTLFALAHFCWGVKDVVAFAIVTKYLHEPINFAGLYMATAAVAEVVGGILIAQGLLKTQESNISGISLAVALLSGTFLVTGLTVNVPVVFGLKFCEGLMSVVIGVLCHNLLILRTPEHLRGRLAGIVGAVTASCLVGGKVLAGVWQDKYGVASLCIFTGGSVLLAVGTFYFFPLLQGRETLAPDTQEQAQRIA